MTVSGLGVKTGVHKIATEFSELPPPWGFDVTLGKLPQSSSKKIP